MKYKGSITDAERGLRVAARFATHLLEQDIRNPKTRSCMMAKVFSEEYRMDSDEDKRIFEKRPKVTPKVFCIENGVCA